MKTPTWLPAPCEGGDRGLGGETGDRAQASIPLKAGRMPGSVLDARKVSVNRNDKNFSRSKGGKTDNQISGKLDSMLGTSVKQSSIEKDRI